MSEVEADPTVESGEEVHPEFDRRFLANIKGKQYATYAGVLDLATKKGLRKLSVFIEQVPGPENKGYAAVYAVAEFEDGRVFQDVGDCSPESTSPQLAPAALRLASTRAKARVLSDALSIKAELFEDQQPGVGGDFAPPRQERRPPAGGTPRAAAEPKASEPTPRPTAGNRPVCRIEGCGRILDQGEVTAAIRAGHPLHCKEHLAAIVGS